eukprot:UN23784
MTGAPPPSYQQYVHQNQQHYIPQKGAPPPSYNQYAHQPNKKVALHEKKFVKKPEVRLYNNPSERSKWDNYADLYAIIMAAERLETVWVRQIVDDKIYETEMRTLISQFRAQRVCLSEEYGDKHEAFFSKYCQDCRIAKHRLLVSGIPATLEHGSKKTDIAQLQFHVSQATQNFVTAQDGLEMKLTAVDEVQPLLSALMDSLNSITNMKPDHPSEAKIRQWLSTMNGMRAAEELSGDQVRQLSLDLGTAYDQYQNWLKNL